MSPLSPVLERVCVPPSVDSRPVPPAVTAQLREAQRRIEAFQDRWDRPQIEQYVAADHELLYQTLAWLLETQYPIGRRFLEWGCGFAVVTAIAAELGLDAIGVEAEAELLDHAHVTFTDWRVDADFVVGDFLPAGSESIADDPTFPSLGHDVGSAYDAMGLDLDDFAIVYGYPWPGEEGFHQQVFARHAAAGAYLLQFCGPNDVRLFRHLGTAAVRRRRR